MPNLFPGVTNVPNKRGPLHWFFASFSVNLFLLVGAVAIPLICLSVYTIFTIAERDSERVTATMVAQSRTLAQAIDGEFHRVQDILEVLAAAALLYPVDNYAALRPLAERATEMLGGSSVAVISPSGEKLLSTRMPGLPLSTLKIMDIFRTGKPCISGVLSVNGNNVLVVAVPIVRDGVTLGVIATAIRSDIFLDKYVGPDFDNIIVSVIDKSYKIVARNRDINTKRGQTLSPRTIKLITASTSGMANIVNLDGNSLMSAYSLATRSGYTALINIPIKVYQAPFRRALSETAVAGAFFIMFGLGLAKLTSMRMRAGIRKTLAAVSEPLPKSNIFGLLEFEDAAEVIRNAIFERDQSEALVKKANIDLNRIIAQRDLLLKEVYHRVKNNLQVVDGLLSMQSSRLMDEASQAAMEDMRNRIYALGLVHQQLIGSDDFEAIEIQPFIASLIANLVISSGAECRGITVVSNVEAISTNLDLAGPLGLVVTELVTNSLKHAFKSQGGTIIVNLVTDEMGGAVLTVSDDGGCFGSPVKAGLGTKIIDGLVKQMNGLIVVLREGGYTSEVRIPLAYVRA